jgi:DNA-binding NarL/FixJ family response regulator
LIDGPLSFMPNLLAFVVEDSPVIQENLIAALEELAPVKVVGTAVDQTGALTWLTDAGNRCDIAIIDIFLRQGSGMGVLRALAAATFERVVLTNYATADIRRQCLALGASAVFDKSGEIDALVAHCVSRAARDGNNAQSAELR